HAGATAITGILTQSIGTVVVIRHYIGDYPNFHCRWDLNTQPTTWRVDNLTTSLGRHTLRFGYIKLGCLSINLLKITLIRHLEVVYLIKYLVIVSFVLLKVNT